MSTPSVRFTVNCLDLDRWTMHFEPEGAERTFARDEVITVEMSGGTAPYEPEIVYLPAGIAVWAWAGAKTKAWNKAGERLDI